MLFLFFTIYSDKMAGHLSFFWKIVIPSHLDLIKTECNMRIFFLASLFIVLLSCNNNINTIGDTMIPSEGYIEILTYNIDETSTVRLDSFPTSLNVLYNVMSSSQLTLGHMNDRITGQTTATPYFQIARESFANIDFETSYVYDSLTLALPFDYKNNAKILAGDTVNMQTYYLYRLTDYPRFNFDDPCIYDNFNLPHEAEPLATLSTKLEYDYLANKALYFKIEGELGPELFRRMRAKDSIFLAPLDFIRYFNGLTIVPASTNTALIPLNISQLALTCHYHLGSEDATATFTIPAYATNQNGLFYAFTNIEHTPSSWLDGVSWRDSVSFKDAQQAVVQGLNGYAIKLKLPYIPNNDTYKTILKAEIVLSPIVGNSEDIPELTNTPIQVFTLDKYSRLISALTDLSGNPVYGYLQANPDYREARTYVIDITDYYNNMISSGAELDPQLNLLIGLRGSPTQIGYEETKTMVGNVATTFDRLVVDELPTLRIYYAKYK